MRTRRCTFVRRPILAGRRAGRKGRLSPPCQSWRQWGPQAWRAPGRGAPEGGRHGRCPPESRQVPRRSRRAGPPGAGGPRPGSDGNGHPSSPRRDRAPDREGSTHPRTRRQPARAGQVPMSASGSRCHRWPPRSRHSLRGRPPSGAHATGRRSRDARRGSGGKTTARSSRPPPPPCPRRAPVSRGRPRSAPSRS